ncbi:MAG: 6-carboxytetrahydropterin synthase [Phycisphaerae bacterium]|nr:6-carboxytetrahydropterin synthase [Phycisphaerae bacterium]
MYEVSVEEEFQASHALPLPGGGAEAPHEHEWRMTATFRSKALAKPMGIVVDFVEVKKVLKSIADELEGADLNTHAAFADRPPSAELVAEYLASQTISRLGRDGERLYRLEVTEAPGCSAAFYPNFDQT